MTNAARKPRIKRRPVDVRRISRRRSEPLPPPSRGFVLQMEFMRWCLYAIPFVLIPISLFFLIHARNDWNLAHDAKRWPTAPGVVVSTGIIDRSGKTFSFDPYVTYSYAVDGRSYVGDVLRTDGYDYSSRSGANAKLDEYPVGSAVDVRYDPHDPSRSVLEPGVGGRWWYGAGIGSALGIGGMYLLIFCIRDYWELRLPSSSMPTP